MAVKAGCDLILLRGNLQHFEDGYFAIIKAVNDGIISIDDIDAAVERILTQKKLIGLFEKPLAEPDAAERIVGCREHKELAKELAEKSVSCIKSEDMPLDKDKKTLVVCIEPQKLAAAEDSEQCVDMLYKAVKKRFSNVDGIVAGLEPEADETKRISAMAENYDVIIIGSCNTILYKTQAELINNLLKTDKTVIVTAMDSPYDYEVLENVHNYICTYGVAAASAAAATEVMLGENAGAAVPPVELKIKTNI